MNPTRTPALAALAALALAATGCGANTEQSTADKFVAKAQEEASSQPQPTAATAPEAEKVEPGPGEGDIDTKPRIPAQEGDPPKELVAQDVIVGTGPEAKDGDQVSVNYVGVLFSNGKEFDSSWKRNQPIQFTIGSGQVIQGWDQGVIGMKVGGRRRLTIPPDLAYGAQGQPPDIPANATLVFDVDLKKVG
jgi:peptidylprolyl isomerase